MGRFPDRAVLEDIRSALEEIVGPVKEPTALGEPALEDVDVVLRAPDTLFAVEWKPVGDASNVGSAVRQLGAIEGVCRRLPVIPLLAVPFMGETGRRLCAEAGLSWIDLSGNALIEGPGEKIRILGHRNKFVNRGRPADVFAPRSSRVMRVLLMEPERSFTQSELVALSGVDKGRVSRLVKRLEAMGLLRRDAPRSLRLEDPGLALDAWREAYDFERHHITRGHIPVREPLELVNRISDMPPASDGWAFTGLAAAWRLTQFAMFRLVTVMVRDHPTQQWLSAVGFHEEARGANLWIARPDDASLFSGASDLDGWPCVHPLQIYLDLKGHPERAEEAAQEVRRRFLDWSNQ